MDIINIEIDETAQGQRLDKFLVHATDGFSRSRIAALIKESAVEIDGAIETSASLKIKNHKQIRITCPENKPCEMLPEDIPIDIIYEDDDMLVINKQSGLSVHPGAGQPSGTLVNALLHHCGESLSGIGGVERPGIVHRLDKDTSGLMVVAKHDEAHNFLSAQLQDRSLSRTYEAFCWGVMSPQAGRIQSNIARSKNNRQKMASVREGGKEAATNYETIKAYFNKARPFMSHVRCKLETGRTHQIRVHLSEAGCGLIGDIVYGKSTSARLMQHEGLSDELRTFLLEFPRQALHAKAIGFIHPRTAEEMEFECDLPDDLKLLENMLTALS